MKNIIIVFVFLILTSLAAYGAEDIRFNSYYEGDEVIKVSFIRVLNFSVEPDEDRNEIDQGIVFEHQLKRGDGYGISAELFLSGTNDASPAEPGFNLGVLFLTTTHDEIQIQNDVSSYSFYLEGIARASYIVHPNLSINTSLRGGIGLSTFDFEEVKNDTLSGAAEMRFTFGVEIFQAFEIGVTGGSYLWGYPSETIGYGSFVATEASMIF